MGSNLGDPEANLARACLALARLSGIKLGECSPVYRSDPQDVRDQPWFANQVARLYCTRDWTALELLRALLAIEADMGRVRAHSKGPRLIDLDLLLFDAQFIQTPELTVPHPRMEHRAFVLVPLLDIAPDLAFPDGRAVSEVLGRLSYTLAGRNILQPFCLHISGDPAT